MSCLWYRGKERPASDVTERRVATLLPPSLARTLVSSLSWCILSATSAFPVACKILAIVACACRREQKGTWKFKSAVVADKGDYTRAEKVSHAHSLIVYLNTICVCLVCKF